MKTETVYLCIICLEEILLIIMAMMVAIFTLVCHFLIHADSQAEDNHVKVCFSFVLVNDYNITFVISLTSHESSFALSNKHPTSCSFTTGIIKSKDRTLFWKVTSTRRS